MALTHVTGRTKQKVKGDDLKTKRIFWLNVVDLLVCFERDT